MSNEGCKIGAGCLEKLLKVIDRLPRPTLEVTLGSGDELLAGVFDLFVVVVLIVASSYCDSLGSPLQHRLVAFGAPLFTLVVASSDCNSLGSPLQHPLIAFGAPLFALAICLEWRPSTAAEGHLPIALDKNSPDCLLVRGVSGVDVKQFLRGLRLIMTDLMQGFGSSR
jgi:hypothetical protein